jgi:hypothetical protein
VRRGADVGWWQGGYLGGERVAWEVEEKRPSELEHPPGLFHLDPPTW